MKTKATFMQIDLQNLFYAAKNKGQRVDFEKILNHFKERESEFLTDAVIYMIRSPDFDSSKFESKMLTVGYNLRIKESIKVSRGKHPLYKQSNHDVMITIECIDRMNTFDKLILMSGDGDFADLCKYLRDRGKKIEIWSFKDCCNASLEQYADKMNFIEDSGFFYKKPQVNIFGFHWGEINEESGNSL